VARHTPTSQRQFCLAILALGLTACVASRQDHRTCTLTPEAYRRLDLTRWADQEHLRRDAETAETIAIHYADVSPARRRGKEEYTQARDNCMQALFVAVAQNHSLDTAVVRAYTTVRNSWFDGTVLVSFAVLFALVAYGLAGRMIRLTVTEDLRLVAVAVIAIALAAALLGMMFLDMWSTTVESLRLGSWHLSYRADRIPWTHHRSWLFTGSVALFCLITLLRYARWRRLLGRVA
jgi:hypothetical protein